MKLSIIGSGNWDTDLITIFSDVCGVYRIYGDPKDSPWTDSGYILSDDIETIMKESDAIVIASVPASRYKHVYEALEAGCHVWVEPPLAFNSKDAYELVRKANESNLLLFIGHRLCYSSLLASMLPFGAERDIIKSVKGINKRRYVNKDDGNPVWTLGSDMVALLVYLGLPLSKFELYVDDHACENKCRLDVEFKNGFVFRWDALKNEENLLEEAAKAFLSSIETQDHFTRTDGEHGLAVVRALEFLDTDNG